MINVYADRIEYVSFGGLLQGIDLDEIMEGVSRLRNPYIAKVFEKLGIIEAYGTGIPRIFNSYKGTGLVPKMKATEHIFRMTLPKRNSISGRRYENDTKVIRERGDNHISIPETDEDKVYRLLKDHNSLTRFQIQEALGFSKQKTVRHLSNLVTGNKVQRIGTGSNVLYRR
jgi:ATP-dependent DNA helicase RecG